jgi:NitT/TauT family transport system permease protein
VVPVVFGLQSVPKIAIAPLLVAYLGFGLPSKVFTAALLCFFPLFVATVTGMRSVDPGLLDLYRVASASRLHLLRHVRIPAAAPYLFAGLQVAVVLAVIGSVVSEFVASTHGLGFIVKSRSQDLDVSMMFAAIATLSLMGVTGNLLVRLAQRRLVFW